MRRLWSKVEQTEGCWLWTAARMQNGYGRFWLNGRVMSAHRAVYVLLVGPIPEGLELDHLCRNRACVNPSHLEPVTHAVNLQRGHLRENNGNLRKTHCPVGHPYDVANTCHKKDGRRSCRMCAAVAQRRRRAL